MTPADFTAARERLHMTRSAFARALGVAPNTVTKYERGRVRIPRYIALAIAALCQGLPPVGEQAADRLNAKAATREG